MGARLMATTVPAGLRMGSLSAQARGTTVGDIHTTDVPMVAALTVAMATKDAGLGNIVRQGEDLKAAVRRRASTAKVDAVAADSTAEADTVAADPTADAGNELRMLIRTSG